MRLERAWGAQPSNPLRNATSATAVSSAFTSGNCKPDLATPCATLECARELNEETTMAVHCNSDASRVWW